MTLLECFSTTIMAVEPDFPASPRTGVRDPTSKQEAHSRPNTCSLVANADLVPADKVVDPL
jgi:hypothetical protein